jgi:RimJ/RimL family protein N-acetyltransferase
MVASPLTGRLVRLRAVEVEDFPLFHTWINDPAVVAGLANRYPLSLPAVQGRVISGGESDYRFADFAIESLADGQALGSVTLRGGSGEDRSGELGLLIGERSRWRSGFGTDATRTMCRFGFEMMNLHRIWLDVFVNNAPARHVYEKVGFRVEAVRREAAYKEGVYLDVLRMGLLAQELHLEDAA